MVDIHCHILPGLDDGPETIEMACEMAEMAIAEGVTHIIGTPHSNDTHHFDPALVRSRRDELQARFDGRLTLTTGCDFHMSFDNLQNIRTGATCYTLNQKNYLLVEFAQYSIPPSMDQALHELQLAGLRPIITHPERNPLLRAQQDRLFQWLRQGCYVQVTAGALQGKWGPAAQEAAERWLEGGAVHFCASDAHNVTSRPPKVKEAYDLLLKRSGEDLARALFVENPLAAFEGRDLPYQPELSEEFAPQGEAQPKKRKRFWLF